METKLILQNDPLWKRIQHFSLDHPDADFPFSKKLAKEENWTSSFTAKAIEEYKKFVYLCCTLPNGASPSGIVDKVCICIWCILKTTGKNSAPIFCKGNCIIILHKADKRKTKNTKCGLMIP